MKVITVDFETYYDKDFGFKKHTTEEYIRDERFQIIGVAVKVEDGETVWLSGEFADIKAYLHDNYDWANCAVLAHNMMFDGAILSWLFGIEAKFYADTLCMARALHGIEVGGSLAALAKMYSVGEKGDEVVNALGKRREEFTEEDLGRYGDYCINDVALTYKLFKLFMRAFPKQELKVIDMTLRMFLFPVLQLDTGRLEEHLETLREQKEKLLTDCGITKDELMSNPKFAEALKRLGVVPPTKISLRTGKEAFAFAKSDEKFKALHEHEDNRVQALVAARVGLKSTLEETRTERFLAIGMRGALPVPIKYYAAHTSRWGGQDKINLQNLPSRGQNAKILKSCIVAPAGHTLIQADSAQIEARVLAWLAEQTDLLQAFRRGEDVYRKMAANIYNIKEEEVTGAQRFIGKTTILGCGYGLGAVKFREMLKVQGVDITPEEAQRIISVYRSSSAYITTLWRQAQNALMGMYQGDKYAIGRTGVIRVVPEENGLLLPSGILMRYTDLKAVEEEKGLQFSYKTREGRVKIYGGKVIENVCQGIARCVMAEQMLRIAKRYKVLLTVHDSVVCSVPDAQVDEAAAFISSCMRWSPDWAVGLPVRGDVEVGKNYGECTAWIEPIENHLGRSVG